jgi:hypothetical protein
MSKLDLPTPQMIGTMPFCINEILNHSEYAYLVMCLENGYATVIYYRYPQRYGPFLDDLAKHTPIHNVHFAADNLLSFSEKHKPCPCQHEEDSSIGV